MKFTDGQWVSKPGYQLLHPMQVFDVKFDGVEMIVYTYTKPVSSRSQTLDQGTFTLRFTTEQADTIHVRTSHYEGMRTRGPSFTINRDTTLKPVFRNNGNSCHFTSGKLEAVVYKEPFAIDYYYDGRHITGSVPRAQANITDNLGGVYMREQLSLSVGEYVYGLGERFTAFAKNGQTVEMWNEDGGTASELSYKNIPFYVTNRNYGVFAAHPEKVSFEVASENVERVQFSVPGQRLDYTVIGGGSMAEVLANYNKLTGKPALPPAWSFGLWLSTSFTTDYDEETVNSFIDGMAEREIPLHVFHFDCFWMEECEWCNFTWNSKTFPDPKGMLSRLKNKGLKICVWINPYIAQKSPLFHEAMEKRYLVEYANGDVWQWDRWQAGMGLVDFTNPEACAWYQGKLKALLDMGVDCFKTDFGERIPTDVVWHDGSDPLKMHNYYTYLYNWHVFDLLTKERGKGEAVLFARSATAGGQQFPIHWGGDCWGTYESMAESLRGGLSLCMSGFGFWSHDMGGFEQTSPAHVYKRWAAFGLLSTHSRLHGSTSYRVPWVYDEEAVDVLRHFTQLRCRLMPYLWAQANHTAQSGIPMMRSMILEFSADPACRFLDNQYLLGSDLLVAPVFSEEGRVEYYLPKGNWVNLFNGEHKQGGAYYDEKHDFFSLPLYIRGGAIMPLGSNSSDVVYDYEDNLTLHITPLNDGGEASCAVYRADGTVGLQVTLYRSGYQYTIQLENQTKRLQMLFYGLNITGKVKNAIVTDNQKNLVLEIDPGTTEIILEGESRYQY